MSEKTYRVIQWMTGDVGQVGIRPELHGLAQDGHVRVPVVAEDRQRDAWIRLEVAEPVAVVPHRDDEAAVVVDPVPAWGRDRRAVVPDRPDDGVARLLDEPPEVRRQRRCRHAARLERRAVERVGALAERP